MTQKISQCDAIALAFSSEASEQMFILAHNDGIPEMAEQAGDMLQSSLTLRITAAAVPLLVLIANNCTERDPMNEYLFTTVVAINTGLAVRALKRLYDTACYLRTALVEHPILRARLLGSNA